MGASPPKPVVELVERFERDRKVFQSPEYKEESLHKEFIDPLFESLGWDVSNKAGLTEACPEQSRRVFKPVIHEESIKACPEQCRRIAGATKAPDYTFRIGGRRVFFAEARKRASHIFAPGLTPAGFGLFSKPMAAV